MLATITTMNRVMDGRRGFTLIELIVVIAIIGILATISVIGFSRYQAETRDARRASSISVIAESLEKYYDANGEYPSCTAITATPPTISTDTLKNIDTKILIAPQAPSSTENSIKCTGTGNTLTTNGVDFFEYQGDGSESCNTDGSCLKYTLKYKKESNNTIASLDSRRNASIATSGNITNLTANSLSFSSINLSWQKVSNAISYNIEQSNDINFTTGVVAFNSNTNSAVAGGLTAGNTYYYRVMPVGSSGTAQWSNKAVATTRALSTPVIAATANSNTQITVTWSDVQFETGYTLQYSTSGTSWTSPTPTTVNGIAANATSYIVNGLSTGVQYFFRLQAIASGDTSDWSGNANATTYVPAPASLTATAVASTQINTSWAAVSVATTYTLQYSPTSNFSSSVGTVTGITATSQPIGGLTQGLTYYFRVYALVGTAQSAESPNASATTPVDTPGAPGITAYRPGAVRAQTAGGWIVTPGAGNWYYAYANAGVGCPAGSYPVYQFVSHYNANGGGTPGPANPAYTGATTSPTWFMVQPTSGYKIKFGARAYCQGPSTNSGWGGWNYSCAASPGSTVACNF